MMLSPDLQHEIRDALAGLRGTRAKALANEYSRLHGLSLRQIYKITADIRGDRRTRIDKGKRRIDLPDGAADKVLALVHQLGWNVDLALSESINMGLIPADSAPSASTFRRWLREQGVAASGSRDNRVCRLWSASGPNEIHQTDSTVSATFYLDSDGSVGYEPLKDLSNKPGNRKQRLILYALVDDYSRVGYARYYLGENQTQWLDFLFHAWAQKDDPSVFPFEGIPKVLYADNGSCLKKSGLVRERLAALGVSQKFTEPYSPQSKGKVERIIGVIQSQFEKLFLLQKPRSLDEANAWIERYLQGKNNKKHRSTGEVPFQRWLKRSEAIRRMPAEDILKTMKCVDDTRVLDVHLYFSVNGETFRAPYEEPFRSMPRGQKVHIRYALDCPFEMNLVVGRMSIPALHVPKGQPLPISLPAAREAITLTSETSARLKAVGLEDLKPFDVARPVPDVRYLPARDVELSPVEKDAEPQLTYVAAMRALHDAGVCEQPAQEVDVRLVESLLAGRDRIPESRVAEIVKRFKGRDARSVLAELAGVPMESGSPAVESKRAASAG